MHINSGLHLYKYADAPHAGARIEISSGGAIIYCQNDAPHAGARIEILLSYKRDWHNADAPHAGARIEIILPMAILCMRLWTPPTRGRELKCIAIFQRLPFRQTPPTRGRELKFNTAATRRGLMGDAPHAGARIEISRH